MDPLEQLLRRFALPAYSIELTAGEPADICDSKFGGSPYFENGQSWPACTKCALPLFFICQINMRECPELQLSQQYGLISFFYCWKCYPWESKAAGWLVRNSTHPSAAKYVRVEMPPAPKPKFSLLSLLDSPSIKPTTPCSVRLRRFDSVPGHDELSELISEPADEQLLLNDEISDDYYDIVQRITGRKEDFSSIAGGWAEWIQSYPDTRCAECGERTRQLLQVGSEQAANLMFGDAGAVYLRYCPQHPEQISLDSQCF